MLELAVRPQIDASINCFALSPSFAAKWHRLLCYEVALIASGCYHEWTMRTSQGPCLSSGCFSTGWRCTLQDMKVGIGRCSCWDSLVRAMFDASHFLLWGHAVRYNKHANNTSNRHVAVWPCQAYSVQCILLLFSYGRMAPVGVWG